MLNRDLIQFGIFNKLSVDKSMVPYFGRHSAKMFIKEKPICFDFKILVLMRQQWLSIQHKNLSRKGEIVTRSTFGILRNQQHG